MTGYNLPDGLSEQSPFAPWNQPDPWVGKTCGECRNARECPMLDGSTALVCVLPISGDALEVDAEQHACEAFA